MIILILLLILATLLFGAAAIRGLLAHIAGLLAGFCGLMAIIIIAIYFIGDDAIYWLCGIGTILAIGAAIFQANEKERLRRTNKRSTSDPQIWDGHLYRERSKQNQPKSYIPGHNDEDWHG